VVVLVDVDVVVVGSGTSGCRVQRGVRRSKVNVSPHAWPPPPSR
jgi:succinate dehydrogenase/fumarate reductase flavoprotein subunit